jgi:hypothetical protein
MARINLGRVILGGLLAGLVLNVSEFLLHEKVIKADEMAAMTALGKGGATGSIGVWVVYGFVYGIVLVWLYAAIRPRFGAGARTAACAGLTGWFFNSLLSSVAMVNMGLFAANLMVTSTIWALVDSVIAAVVGAWLYRET